MDQFYTKALALCKDYQYPEFHKYIVRKMENWYRMFPSLLTDKAEGDDSVSSEEGYVVDVPAVDASTLSRSFAMSDGEEAGVGDQDIFHDCEVAADNVTAVDAAEARLADSDGAAAGGGAVAATGAAPPRRRARSQHQQDTPARRSSRRTRMPHPLASALSRWCSRSGEFAATACRSRSPPHSPTAAAHDLLRVSFMSYADIRCSILTYDIIS